MSYQYIVTCNMLVTIPITPPSATTDPPLLRALATVGDRWSLAVIDAVLGGSHRFGQILEAVPGLAPNILSQRLSRLEAAGLIVARAYQQRPPRFVYQATRRADALAAAIEALRAWGADDEPVEAADDASWV